MKKWVISLIAVPTLLFGCSQAAEKPIDSNAEPIDPATLEVVVDIITPKQVSPNETVELAAHVTQNGENVDDADSVEFEVWESGFRDEGQMIQGKLDAGGVYKAEITFNQEGVYYMFAHTTARGLHVMPKQQIIVGNPDMSKVIEDGSSETTENHLNAESDEHSETHSEEHSSN